MVHVHDLPRAKGRGGDDGAMPPINKRRLQPAKLQGSSVGSKGAGIASFFKADPEHHARAYRPGQGYMAGNSAAAAAARTAAVTRTEKIGEAVGAAPAASEPSKFLLLDLLVDAACPVADKPPVVKKTRNVVATAPFKTWPERAAAIWLHLALDPGSQKPGSWSVLAPKIGGLNRTTAQHWTTCNQKNAPAISKWLPITAKLTWARVKAIMHRDKAFLVGLDKFFAPEDTLPPKMLDGFRPYLDNEGTVVLSADTAPEMPGPRRASLGKKNPAKFVNVNPGTRHIQPRSSRPVRWPEAEAFAKKEFTDAWKVGKPLTALDLKMRLRAEFPAGNMQPAWELKKANNENINDFHGNYMGADTNSLARYKGWIDGVLDRAGFSLRHKTVSQKIPDSWRDDAKEFVKEMRKKFKAAGVTKVIGMDQTFILFYPNENEAVIAPVGAKRVGSSAESDDKEGVTLAVTVELGKRSGMQYTVGQISPAYWVMTGNTCCCPSAQHHKDHSPPHMYKFTPRDSKNKTPGYVGRVGSVCLSLHLPA